MELKTKGAGGGGAGREMMNSKTFLPGILTSKHFLAVSAICLDRSDFACTCFQARFWYTMWLSDLYDHICYQGNNLFGSEIKCGVGGGGEACFTMEA